MATGAVAVDRAVATAVKVLADVGVAVLLSDGDVIHTIRQREHCAPPLAVVRSGVDAVVHGVRCHPVARVDADALCCGPADREAHHVVRSRPPAHAVAGVKLGDAKGVRLPAVGQGRVIDPACAVAAACGHTVVGHGGCLAGDQQCRPVPAGWRRERNIGGGAGVVGDRAISAGLGVEPDRIKAVESGVNPGCVDQLGRAFLWEIHHDGGVVRGVGCGNRRNAGSGAAVDDGLVRAQFLPLDGLVEGA